MNTLPSAKDIALSPFCFLGKVCARSLLSGDLLIVRRTGSQGRKNIEAPPNEEMVSRVASAAGNQQERYAILG